MYIDVWSVLANDSIVRDHFSPSRLTLSSERQILTRTLAFKGAVELGDYSLRIDIHGASVPQNLVSNLCEAARLMLCTWLHGHSSI